MRIKLGIVLQAPETFSIFPKVEKWLNESSDHQHAFEFFSKNKKVERYRCLMDFVFCEIFTEHRFSCFRYYNEKGPQLKKLITKDQRKQYEAKLVNIMSLAYDLFCEKRRMSWSLFRKYALERVA